MVALTLTLTLTQSRCLYRTLCVEVIAAVFVHDTHDVTGAVLLSWSLLLLQELAQATEALTRDFPAAHLDDLVCIHTWADVQDV